MPDLDRDLTALLERNTPGAVPPFAEVHARARRLARRRLAMGVTAVALAAALPLVRLAVAGPPTGTYPDVKVSPSATRTEGPPPQRITVNGVDLVQRGDAEIGTAWIDADDTSTLVVPAGADAPDVDPNCEPFTVVRILDQGARVVEIRAYAYTPAEPPTGAIACTAQRHPDKLHRLALAAPLGDREVRAGAATVTVVDAGTLLWPSYLPTGYSGPPAIDLVYPRPDRRAGYSQLTYRAGVDKHLYLRQVDPAAEAAVIAAGGQPSIFLPESSFDVVARPTVRGHAAVVFDYAPTQRCLRWRESAGLAVAICTYTSTPGAHLGTDDLLAVAEGLRPRR